MVVAVLHVRAEGGQQLDAQGGDVIGAPLLQMGEADALVALGLQGRRREVADCREGAGGGSFGPPLGLMSVFQSP